MIDPHWGPVVYYIYRLSFFYRAKIQANHVRPLQWSFLLFLADLIITDDVVLVDFLIVLPRSASRVLWDSSG